MQGYQKSVAINKLKQTYAQLVAGVEAAAADQDNTPIHQWQCNESWDEGAYMQEACFYTVLEKIGAKLHGRAPSLDKVFCYQGKPYREYTQLNGEVGDFAISGKYVSDYSWSATMPNGACVVWNAYSWAGSANSVLLIDIDGPYSGYNRFGKDVFSFTYFDVGRGTGLGNNGRSILPLGFESDRAYLLQGCRIAVGVWGSGKLCAALIMNDGWQMKKDYPW